MNNIQEHRNFVQSQIEKSFADDIEKARVGVYADNSQNRRLMRVGQKYGESKNIFKPGHTVRATLPTGKVIEAVYVEPYGKDKHTVRVGKKLYGVTTDNIEKVAGQYAGRKKTWYEKQAMYDKLDDLKDKYFDLKRQRKETEVDMEEELGALGEEVFNNGNNPTVVKYSKLLDKLDRQMERVKERYQKQKAKVLSL